MLSPLAVKRKMKPKIELPTKNRLAARAAAVTGGGGGSGENVGVVENWGNGGGVGTHHKYNMFKCTHKYNIRFKLSVAQ